MTVGPLVATAVIVLVWAWINVTRDGGGGGGWAGTVRRRLPEAFAALPGAAGRDPVTVTGGTPLHAGGMAWQVELPGSVVDGDIAPDRVASGLNRGRVLVEVLEVDRSAPGWATVRAWPRDPLALPNTIPWQPGGLPMRRWGDPWSLGRRRDGSEVLLPLWRPGGGAHHALFAGSTGSGKTRWMLVGLAHAVQLDGVEIHLVDAVKGTDDPDWSAVLPCVAKACDTVADAVAHLERVHEVTMRRPRWEPGTGEPFRLVVIDEVQSITGDKRGVAVLTRLVAEGRSKGLAVWAATQLPLVGQLPSSARTNFRVRVAGRLQNEAEYGAALGGRWPGEHIPDTPSAWGSGFADVDGRGVQRFRGWWADDDWLHHHFGGFAPKVCADRNPPR